MRKNERTKKLLSGLLALAMVVQNFPMVAFAAPEDNLCPHHPEHTAECHYEEGVHECHYVCSECEEGEAPPAEEVVPQPEPAPEHTHVYDGAAQYGEKDDAVHTVTRACTSCEEQPTQTVEEAHAYAEGFCVCGKAEPVHTHAYVDGFCECGEAEPVHTHVYVEGICECGAACEHIYAEGVCTVCSMAEPVQEPQVLTITAWSWVDDYEIIDPDYMDAVIPGVGAENPIDWETLVEFLPAYITAQVNGEEVELPVTWECETFPEAATGGKYTVKAILPAGYVLGEGVTALELDVDLGAVEQYAITPTKPANGDGTESNPYQITSADELYWFANLVNTKANAGGNNNAHAKLMNNITVNENVIVDGALTSDTSSLNVWTAMGKTVFSSGWFGGSFDGNGKTISGLYVNETSNYRGFIGCLGEGASVKNLTITDSYFTSTTSSLGAFVGTMGLDTAAENPVIENCKLIDSVVSGTSYVGGIVGGADYGEIISNCHVYNCAITGTGDNVGGIAGSAGDSTKEAYIRLCSVNDSSVSGANNVGGILGKGGSLSNTKISACCNYNTSVTATTKYAGGILGYTGHCYSCFVTAKVSAPSKQEPFCGYGNNSNSAYDSDVYGELKLFTNSMGFTTEEIEAGVATYYLTKPTAISTVYVLWGQKIGEDKYPSWNPDSNPDYIVYRMDDTENGGYIYYNGDAAAEYEPNEDGIYEIADRSDWYKFAKKAKEDPSIDGILTANIDFTGVASNKMANYVIGVTGKAYTGNFNGNGYSVINLPEVSQSLFDVIGNGGELKNLNLSGAVLTNMDAVCVAGLVYNNLGVISNVTVTDVTVSSGAVAAGIVVDNRGTVTGCTVSDITVTGKTAAGGIAGVNHSGNTIEDCRVVSGTVKAVEAEYDAVAGGICGSSYGGTIKGCTNNADVSAEAGRLETAAGIVGRPDFYSDVSVNIISCSNTGNINGTWAGGISGADSTATHVNISLCYNEGTITGNTAGGIAADGSINAYDLIVNCYNAGAVNAVGTRAMAGGIVGDHSNNTVKNCHNYGKVTSEYVAAPISCTGVGVWPGANELINNHAIEGNIAAPNTSPYLDTEGAASSSDAIVEGSTREAFADGTITAKLNEGNSETVWYQYTEYPILEQRHMHQWSYTLEGTDSIKAECIQTGCDLENNYGGKVSIAAPTELLYDGESKDAVCSYTDWLPDKVDVSYNDIDCVNVTGQDIEASLTYGEATVSISYQIAPRVLTASMVTLSLPSTTYDGSEKTVTVTVKDNSTTLTAGTDYEVTGTTSETEISTGSGYAVTVTGKGNYSGTVTKYWKINKATSPATLKTPIEGWTYLDDPKEPSVTENPENGEVTYTYYVTYSGRTPTKTGTAHGAETEGGVPKYAGTYYVGAVIAETDHYNKKTITPTANTEFVISPKEVTEPTFEGLQPTYPYENGNEIKPTFTLKDDLGNVIPESEYTVSYSDNTEAGTATITVTDNENGNYTVSGTKKFEIATHVHAWTYSTSGYTITATCEGTVGTCPVENNTVTIQLVAPENLTYDGAGKTVTVTQSPADFFNDVPAVIEGAWINAGQHTASLTYGEKTATLTFTIEKATPTIAWDSTTASVNYTGSAAAITAPTVTLVNGETYNGTISYSYNGTSSGNGLPINAGAYEITASIAAQNNYTETTSTNTLTLTINKVAASVTTAPEPVSNLTYNGGEQTLITAGTASGGTMQYSMDNAIWSGDIPVGKDVGNYTVYYKVIGDSNHNDTASQSVTVTITCDHENVTYPADRITDTQHTLVCPCGYEVAEDHTTEKDENKATCNRGKICDLCGEIYGEADPNAHTMDESKGHTCMGYWCSVCESWYGSGNGDNHLKIGDCDCGLTTYPIWVMGCQVTSADLNFVGGLVNVRYDPGENILYLGRNIGDPDAEIVALKVDGDITVNVSGDKTVYGMINVTGSLTITGEGSMTVSGHAYGIQAASVAFGDDAHVIIKGDQAVKAGAVTGNGYCRTAADEGFIPFVAPGSESYYEVASKMVPIATVTIGESTTYFRTFDEALGAWADGSTLTLQADVARKDKMSITNKTVTLDLNGKTLAMDGPIRVGDVIWNGECNEYIPGGLTICDTADGGSVVVDDPSAVNVLKKGILNMTGGKIERANLAVANYGTCNISGGELSCQKVGIEAYEGSTTNISGSPVITGKDYNEYNPGTAIRVKSDATVTISGTPAISGGSFGEFYLDYGVTLNTQPADGNAWRIYVPSSNISQNFVLVNAGDGVTLDAAKFSLMESMGAEYGAYVKDNQLLLCVHTAAEGATAICQGLLCINCGGYFGNKDADAHDWDEGKVTTAPTCSKVGVKTFTCQHDASHTRTEDVAIDADAHDWDEGKVTTAPTCSKVGVKTFTCQHDKDHTYTEDVAIDPDAHSYGELIPAKAAVHTKDTLEPGVDAHYFCGLCDTYFTEDKVETTLEALTGETPEHSYTGKITTDPTCSEKGVETFTCPCGDSYTEDVAIDKNAHAWGETAYDWTADGKACTASRTCLHNSDHVETAKATITSKVKSEPGCTSLGETTYTAAFTAGWAESQTKDVYDIPVKGHVMKETTARVEPDCENEGREAVFTCANGCGHTEGGKVIDALGHDYKSVVTAPDCENGGFTTYTCSVCGDSYVDDEVDALGHKPETIKGYAATCTKPGLTDGSKCGLCGETLTAQKEIPATGEHTYDQEKVDEKYLVSEATCTEQAIYYKSCICGEKGTETFKHGDLKPHKYTDVDPNGYYHDAVVWADQNGITNGTCDGTTFEPDAAGTRAHMITFLWRAAGCPAPKSSEMPFKDVENGEFYTTAVLWAAENGITIGYGVSDIFAPDIICTRGQIITMLNRYLGGKATSTENPFVDVAEDTFYYDAVLWAAENGITNGYGDTDTFAPNITCTRAQIVTFLYRALHQHR